jgi:hypothetical protein
MPNWCYNRMYLESGKPIKDLISDYLDDDKNGNLEFLFDKIIPVPEDLKIKAQYGNKELEEIYKSNLEKHGYAHWYDFCLDKWGTKWTGGDGMFNEDGTSFSFSTAWSPPIPIMKKLSQILNIGEDIIILDYIEEGNNFCGKYIVSKESDIDEFYDNLKDAPKDFLDSLGYEPWEEDEE